MRESLMSMSRKKAASGSAGLLDPSPWPGLLYCGAGRERSVFLGCISLPIPDTLAPYLRCYPRCGLHGCIGSVGRGSILAGPRALERCFCVSTGIPLVPLALPLRGRCFVCHSWLPWISSRSCVSGKGRRGKLAGDQSATAGPRKTRARQEARFHEYCIACHLLAQMVATAFCPSLLARSPPRSGRVRASSLSLILRSPPLFHSKLPTICLGRSRGDAKRVSHICTATDTHTHARLQSSSPKIPRFTAKRLPRREEEPHPPDPTSRPAG